MPLVGRIKNAYREHRTVVLPDYQGIGIGVRFSDAIAQIFIESGKRYYSRTANIRMGGYRNNSPLWRATGASDKKGTLNVGSKKLQLHLNNTVSINRVCFSHEYVGHKSKHFL